MDTKLIYLVELTVYDPAIPGARQVYLCTGSGYVTKPGNSLPNVFFSPCIITPPSLSLNIFSDGRTYGRSSVGVGELVLNNADGEFDWLIDAGLDGRSFVMKLGPENGDYDNDFVAVLTGSMSQTEFSRTRVTIRLRDRQGQLDIALQANKYAGTNSGASGVEGLPSDIAGQPKPLCYGKCLNVAAVPVNTTALIYQVHDGNIQALDAVYDKGIALTGGGDVANLAALQAASISAGQYKTCLALGMFRLGATPAGRVTADVQGDKTGGTYVSSAGSIAKRILEGPGGISSADIPGAVISALNSDNNSTVGFYASSEMSVLDALDAVLGSIGAWYAFDRLGKFNASVLKAPSGTPVTIFDEANIMASEMQVTADEGRGLPAYRLMLDYGRSWTVQSGDDVAAGVNDARRAQISSQWRTVVSTDSSVKTKHLLSPEIQQQSLLIDAAAAATEAARRHALYKVRRDYWQLRVQLDQGNAQLDLGDVIEMVTSRFGYSAGRLLLITGNELDPKNNRTTLRVWG